MLQTQIASRSINRRAAGVFVVGMLCFWASMYVFVPIFPVYAEKMGAPLNIVGLAVGVYGLSQMLLRERFEIQVCAVNRRNIRRILAA